MRDRNTRREADGTGGALGTFEEARDLIGSWIELEYNVVWPHSALGYKTPAAFEESFPPPEDSSLS